ncbi:MAG TPA: hypothetical protein VH854_14760 [Thermoanaerobaculia bacterium]|jgi:hypothetical protein|nr:hypothetical protein [Thermoanaerobaculia bacterium]
MDNFLDAKSMITPGVAGTLVMLLTNALSNNFSLPGKWVALVLSFVCGLLVFGDKKLSVGPRVAFYVVNSLIIFATAVGANGIGAAASTEPQAAPAAVAAAPATPTAVAAAPTAAPASTPGVVARTPRPIERLKEQPAFFKPWLARAAEVQTPH